MSSLNRFHNQPSSGESYETAILITGVASHQAGVAAEYKYLEQLFGQRDKDWKFEIQRLVTENDRKYDIIDIVLVEGESKSIYFDVTDLFNLPSQSIQEQEKEKRHKILAALSRIAIQEGQDVAMQRWQEINGIDDLDEKLVYLRSFDGSNVISGSILTKLAAVRAYAAAWNNLDTQHISSFLAKDVSYSSQEVFDELRSREKVLAYLRGKMETIRSSPNHKVFAEVGETRRYPMYQMPEEPCVLIAQSHPENIVAVVLISVSESMINRIDLCTIAPAPHTVHRTGVYPS